MKTKEKLILSAMKIIDEKGYQNFTVRELAGQLNISDAAIYRHFKSKTEIVAEILKEYLEHFNRIQKQIQEEKFTATEAIEFYITKFLEYYEQNPAMISILQLIDLLSHENEFKELASKIVYGRLELLKSLAQYGIDNKEFDNVIDAETLAFSMLGTLNFITLVWKLQGHNFLLTDKVQTFTNQIKAVLTSSDKQEK